MILADGLEKYGAHFVLLVEELVLELKAGAVCIAEEIDNQRIKPLVLLLAALQVLLVGNHIGKLVLELSIYSLEIILEFEGTRLR